MHPESETCVMPPMKNGEGGDGRKEVKSGSVLGMEENLKKAATEMLVLFLLRERDMYVGEITEELMVRTDGALSIVFPYSVLYRLISFGYIIEAYKKIAPDGRRRQYFQITEQGISHLKDLRALYRRFTGGIDRLFTTLGEQPHEDEE